MSLLEITAFRFCPFCGEDLPQEHNYKFCPVCGGDFTRRKDIKKLQPQNPERQNETVHAESKNHKAMYELCEQYSVVLKDSVNRQALSDHLRQVLTRSVLAIRMAVDNIPSVIIYKGKIEDMENVMTVFVAEMAGLSIIAGDYAPALPIDRLFSNFSVLPAKTRSLLETIPANMWLGDHYTLVFLAQYHSTEGIVAPSDQNIYYFSFDMKQNSKSWMVISFYVIRQVRREDKRLFIVLIDNKEHVFTFSDEDTAKRVQALVTEQVKALPEFFIFEHLCKECGTVTRRSIYERSAVRGSCKQCGHKAQTRLLRKNC
jgi:predicted RNA-binding Zn-ribbon protein involved in translation (DUF1610 family)